jgi:hypothetical protein
MKLAMLLHFYQPNRQEEDILDRIVHECYLPLTRGMLERPNIKMTANLSGVLVQQLINHGYDEVIENFRMLGSRGSLSFTGSAMYHALLPLLPVDEISRQLFAHAELNNKVFGSAYSPSGFFSPEMAINDAVLKVIAEKDFSWTAVSELSFDSQEDLALGGTGTLRRDCIYEDSITGIKVFPRQKRVSSLILSALCRTSADVQKETQDIHGEGYWFCAMDAETFGHHRIGHARLLFDMMDDSFFDFVSVDDLLSDSSFSTCATVVRPSTWTNQEQDFWLDDAMTTKTFGKSFILWKDPENPIHTKQWELTHYVIGLVRDYPNKDSAAYKKARALLDSAEASDQYWWASAKPWWSLELVVLGAFSLKGVLQALGVSDKEMQRAEELYREIIDLVFTWQRTGYVRKVHLAVASDHMKVPFKDRTPPEWFNQIVLEFELQMNEAAARYDFEKAVKWRDSLYKIKTGGDKYDFMHVVDELWTAHRRSNLSWGETEVKPFLKHTWDEFSDFSKDHFRCVSSREEFEKWKATGEPGVCRDASVLDE